MANRRAASDVDLAFLAGGGEMGALMRAHDWSRSSLGPPAVWPQALRTVVRLILNTGHPMYIWWGETLACLYNDAYRQSIGPERHPGSLGLPAREVWEEIWPIIGPQIEQVMSGRGATWHENALVPITRNGRLENVYWTYSYGPIDDESAPNGVGGVLVVCTETTQTVRVEAQLRELNETLERRVDAALAERKILADIVESTDAFIQVADTHYRWLAINRASVDEWERIFGIRPAAGDSMLELLAHRPEHQAAVKAVWRRALAGEEFTTIQEFGDPTLARRYYEIKFNTLRGQDGEIVGAYQFVYDVTERLRDQARLLEAEEHLRQAQKIEAIGQLTGGVAHDFNNLLQVITGGLSLLEKNPQNDRRQRIMEGMRQAADRGASLSRQLLAFSRRQPLQPETIDLAIQLESMREILDRTLRGDVHIQTRFPADTWPVKVDPTELELAILNLCVNARDAMPQGGTIVIRAENAARVDRANLSGDFVRLAVSDSGLGMSKEVLARAFEPFFTTKEIGKGSGLGLAQVYGFATQSGGAAELQSEPGSGTTVSLLLPRSAVAPVHVDRRSDPVSGDGESMRPLSVLLVEDDDGVAALVAEMLSQLGHGVTRAKNAESALAVLSTGPSVDFVFSDIMMAGRMNGLELAREVRRCHPEMPMLLTSGYSDAMKREAEAEQIAVLAKPYEIERLKAALLVALQPLR